MNVGKLSLQTFFRKRLLKQKTTYIKNLFPSWLNRSEAHVMLFCGKTCPWHCGKNEIVWIYLNSLCHTRIPKHQNCCFSWHHEWKRETINHLNIFIHLMKEAIKWLWRWRNKCFCKASYIIWNVRLLSIHFTTFFVAKVI